MSKRMILFGGSVVALLFGCTGDGTSDGVNGPALEQKAQELATSSGSPDSDQTPIAPNTSDSATSDLASAGNLFGYGGVAETVHTSGSIDRTNPFFLTLGINLRTCETCHSPAQGWTITAQATGRLFLSTGGLAPLFMTHDTGSRPDADLSTLLARWKTFKDTLVAKGLIRFTRIISPTAEFAVTAVNDPYGFSTLTQVSAFRRPSPTANQSKVPQTGWAGAPADPFASVANTSIGATRLHEQRADALPTETVNAMRDFQLGVVFAQSVDPVAGPLNADGAKGGAVNLLAQPFYVGINDIQGLDPQGHPFTRKVFNLYDAWANVRPRNIFDLRAWARASIYRGQELFNFFEFNVSGVPGLNDVLGQSTVRATCSTCHNSPNVGGHSVYRVFDTGTANEPSCAPEITLLTLQNKTTGATRKVCDMGRATGSGLWSDVGRFRAPPLRGLPARAPYFHDGQARDLAQVIRYYEKRFQFSLSDGQRQDLEAFLRAL